MLFKSYIKRLLISDEVDSQMNQIAKKKKIVAHDPWGLNIGAVKMSLSLFKQVYDKYFRVEVHGVDNIPADGPVLIIANHSGQLPLDGIIVATALTTREKNPRLPRAMIERFFPTIPFLGNFLNSVGGVTGDPVNCGKMLARGEAIIVFPEGVRGSGKLYKDRYQLQRFGNGFLHLAMQHKTPIVPVGVVGCEETIPSFANITPAAKLLGIPYVPLALPVVLPAKVILNFGEPMYFDDSVKTEEQVTEHVEEVKNEIRGLIDQGLEQREGVFL